jgi:hypothetical protein
MARQGEGNLQRRIQRALKKEWPNCFVRKIWGGEFQHAGSHDLHVCIGGRFVGIEVKMPGKKPTELQQHEHIELQLAGGISLIGTSPEQVIAALRPLLANHERTL